MAVTVTDGPSRRYLKGGDNYSRFSRAYNTFSGADITAVFAGVKFSELQGLAYSIEREKAGIWTLGQVAPRSYSRGKRVIAGSFAAVNFDRNALLDIFDNSGGMFLADKDDIRPDWTDPDNLTSFNMYAVGNTNSGSGVDIVDVESGASWMSQIKQRLDEANAEFQDALDAAGITNVPDNIAMGAAESRAFQAEMPISNPYEDQEVAKVWHADQILPFNIAVAAANEYGAAASMKIFGVEILNESSGFSVDSMVFETSWTFVAREIGPWQPSKASQEVARRLYEANNQGFSNTF